MFLKKLTHALHHLFNPHCSECETIRERDNAAKMEHELEKRVCHACETLKQQLAFQNDLIRELTKPTVTVTDEAPSEIKTPVRGVKPWAVQRAALEHADRIKASEIRLARSQELKKVTVDNLDEEIQSLG